MRSKVQHRSGAKKAHDESGASPQIRRLDVPLTLIALVALSLRLVFIFQFRQSPFFYNLFSDSQLFDQIAGRIIEGTLPHEAFFMSPLYPYVLACIKTITGDGLLWMRVLQAVAGAGASVLIYYTARELWSRNAGLIASALSAICPVLIFYDGQILFDSFQTFLVAALLHSLVRAVKAPGTYRLYWIGVVLGLMTVNRASSFLVAILVALLLWKLHGVRPVRLLQFLGVPIVVFIAPFAIHNASQEGVFVPITSSGGYNFYAGNNAGSAGMYHMPEAVDLYADPNGKQWAERELARSLNSNEVSNYWFDKSWQWISDHPGDYMVLLGRKALTFFSPNEFDQMGLDMGFVRREYGTIIDLPLPGFAALFVLACIGVAIGVRKKLPVIIPIALFFGLYLGSIVFFVNGRIRLPVFPVLTLFGGLALDRIVAALRERDGRIVFPVVLSAVAATLVMMVPSHITQSWDQEYIRLGQIAFDKRNASDAQKYFELSIEQRKTVQGLTNLGNAYAAQGKVGQAENCYAEALRLDATWPLLHFNLGNLLYQQGRRDQAEACWKRAVELRPNLAPAWLNLGLAAYTQDRLEDALQCLTKAHEYETDPKVLRTIERDITSLKDRLKVR